MVYRLDTSVWSHNEKNILPKTRNVCLGLLNPPTTTKNRRPEGLRIFVAGVNLMYIGDKIFADYETEKS